MLAELLELAPGGVEETTLPDGTVEYAVYGAPGELPALPELTAAAGSALVEVRSEEVADDWQDRWREFHQPLVLDSRLAVRPPWEPPQATAIEVVIDPGRAFGTGAHATTRMCLELLLDISFAWRKEYPKGELPGPLVDLGCGSGVLAIAAAKLGWAPVLAVDNDPAAARATRENARANCVEVEVRRLDLRTDPLPAARTTVANLLAPLLMTLAARLRDGPRPERLIISGLLAEEGDRVADAFAHIGLREQRRRSATGWSALLLA